MTPPRYWHLSIRFYFFQLCLPPGFPSPPGAPTDINVYGGDPDKEIEGATTCNFVGCILWVEVSPKTAILVLGM